MKLNPAVPTTGGPNGLGAGNADTHFFQRALEDYRDKNPEDSRPFHEMETTTQRAIILHAQRLKTAQQNERRGQ